MATVIPATASVVAFPEVARAASPVAAKPRAYRGKYPTRIAEVGSLTGRPGVVFLRTNDGRQFEARACALSGQHPAPGQDIAEWAGLRPFRRAYSRSLAALSRVARGADQTVPSDGVDARTLATACLTMARRACAMQNATRRPACYAYAAVLALELARDHSGGEDWTQAGTEAWAILSAKVMPAHRRAGTRQLRAKHAGTPLLAAYRAHRAHKLGPLDRTARTASASLSFARQDVARLVGGAKWRARLSGRSTANLVGHGDVLRTRTNGKRRTFVVVEMADDDMGAPWEEHDGHGVIRQCDSAVHRDRVEKAPGEVLFSSEERGAYVYAYDLQATTALARRDGWGLSPEDRADLAVRLGRVPTSRQVTAEAVRRDFERMRAWVRDEWNWIGIALVEMPRDEERDPRTLADAWANGNGRVLAGRMAASLWGIESDSGPEYFDTEARELLSEVE